MNTSTIYCTSCQLDNHAARHFVDMVVDTREYVTTLLDYPWRTVALGSIAEAVYKAAKKTGTSKRDAHELRRVVFFVGDCPETAVEVLQGLLQGGFDSMRASDICRLLEELAREVTN